MSERPFPEVGRLPGRVRAAHAVCRLRGAADAAAGRGTGPRPADPHLPAAVPHGRDLAIATGRDRARDPDAVEPARPVYAGTRMPLRVTPVG
ncbi:hypothetical protein Snoj_19700 [Streptomyces nojiriensis]|uniref:Uncharacterized protein n=1 Tax=Streptomyces nojiriensis TaxID=66374 RepID=A0ABQ3SIU2_9ACTN|nr:hypothetical protein GCM10010205_62350 [Streptomyces nojiriensis]GHI68052.1 hypothetical protein Snoj_19700 [Streptomyces nojiriensis]